MSPQEKTTRLWDVAVRVARRWLTVLAVTAAVAGLAVLAAGAVPKEYTATASLTVSPLTTNPFSAVPVTQQINIVTERSILASTEVARLAADKLGRNGLPAEALLEQTDVAAPTGSQVLTVSVELPDPVEAAAHANAMAQAYLAFRAEGASEVAAGYIAALDERIAELNALGTLTDGERLQLADLQEQRGNLLLVANSPGRIIGFATPPTQASSMGLASFLAAGLAGGLILGTVAALLRDRTDPRIRTAHRLAEHSAAPVVRTTGTDDDEGLARTLRILRSAKPRTATPHSTAPVTAGVVFLSGEPADSFIAALAERARSTGLRVVTATGKQLPAAAGDGHDDGLILIDASHLSGTRRAALAERLDAVVVVAEPSGTLSALRRLQDDLAAVPRILPVFLTRGSRQRPVPEPAPEHAMPAEPDRAPARV
jgi:capsular polysaccharide biosynthesis protein